MLFERIPRVNDPQAAWLLLMMCASTRCNFWLRAVRPELTEAFATRHDANVWNCLRTILATPRAPAPYGLGLASAHRARVGAHWASWADCVLMVRRRHPVLAETWIHNIAHGDAPCFLAVRSCQQELADAGLEMPSCVRFTSSRQRGVGAQSDQGGVATEGNQASRAQVPP